MLSQLRKYAGKTRAYNAERVHVQSNLAVTPTQMAQLTERGIPISSQVLGAENFDDGEVSPLTDVPFLYRRGVDISDISEYQQRCRSKVSEYVKSQKPQ